MVTQLTNSFPAWSTDLISELEVTNEKAKELTSGLTREQLNWQPASGAWSIGQCLQHLCIFNEIYLPAISASLKNKPARVVPHITPGWFARWFIRRFVVPSPATMRASAPKKIVPASLIDPSVLERFLLSNEKARELILHARKYDVNRIRFVNPVLPILRFTVGAGLVITCGHERRHLLQAERVKQSPTFPC